MIGVADSGGAVVKRRPIAAPGPLSDRWYRIVNDLFEKFSMQHANNRAAPTSKRRLRDRVL